MKWYTVTLILCVFGTLKEFRPNEPFVTNYLTGHWKNFTETQVNQKLYPLLTYSLLPFLVVAFLLIDLVRYKPAIILCGLSGACTYVILRFGSTILHMQISHIIFSIMQSTDIAYYTYIYAKVDEQRYQTVTSWTKCATLFGRSACGIVAQLTTSYGLLDYEQLNYLTIGACSLAAVWACFLPPVEQSIYFNKRSNPPSMGTTSISIINLGDSRKNGNEKTGQPELHLVSPTTGALSFGAKLRHAYSLLWSDFLQAYSSRRVVKWSLWWALATCGYIQVVHNIHLLWIHAVEAQHLPKDTKIYNGAVEAIDTLTSAVIVAGIGTLRLNWSLLGEPILAIFSLIEGLLLVAFCISYKLWVLYAARIAFGVIFHSIITIANFEVAKRIAKDSKGLIFGINSFFALLFQTILTLVVIAWLKLHITSQFIIYGAYYGVLGLLFAVMSVLTIIKVVRSENPVALWITKSYECDTTVN